MPCLQSSLHHPILISVFLWVSFRCTLARPSLVISGHEALPDDDLSPVGSGPEPMLNLNIGTAPYASDILQDGVASQAFEDTGAAPQIVSRIGQDSISSSAQNDAVGLAELDAAVRKRSISSDDLARARKTSDVQSIQNSEGARRDIKMVSTGFKQIQEISNRLPKKCRNVKDDVVVESGMRNKSDVVLGGLATPSWSPTATRALAVLGAPESLLAFAVHLGKGAILSAPKLEVSDAEILAVQFIEKDDEDDSPSLVESDALTTVFIAQHFCKRQGSARVSVELPLVSGGSSDYRAGEHLCPGPAQPVVFSYMKSCTGKAFLRDKTGSLAPIRQIDASQNAAKSLWKKVVAADDENVVDLIRKQEVSSEAPWSNIVPTGGVRTFVIVLVIVVVAIGVFEFGTIWVNKKVKQALADMGPEVFGVKTTLDHLFISLSGGHFSYCVRNWTFHNPPGNYEGPYLIRIAEVRIWLNVTKMICSCFNEIEVVSLIINGLSAEVEVDGYVMGQPNIMVVLKKMEANNKQFKEDMDKLKTDLHHTGIDPHEVLKGLEGHIQNILSRVKLQEVFIGGITYHLSTKLGGIKTALADLEFHNFTEHHGDQGRDSVGAKNIAYFLGHEIFAALARDIGGVEVDHGRFENMISSIKQWIK